MYDSTRTDYKRTDSEESRTNSLVENKGFAQRLILD